MALLISDRYRFLIGGVRGLGDWVDITVNDPYFDLMAIRTNDVLGPGICARFPEYYGYLKFMVGEVSPGWELDENVVYLPPKANQQVIDVFLTRIGWQIQDE